VAVLRDIRERIALLKAEDPEVRDLAAAEIGDLLEADMVPLPVCRWLMPILVERAIAEPDLWVQERLFSAISSASVEVLSGGLNWDPIAADLNRLDPACLEHALDILGFSANAKYRKMIRGFLKHPSEDVVLPRMHSRFLTG